MGPPAPIRGLVVGHASSWSRGEAAWKSEGAKDRPTVVISASGPDESGNVRVLVVPITHTPPVDPDGGLGIPDEVERRLGLEAERQWVVFDGLNRSVWPGHDLI